jgi:protein XagA
MALRVPCFPLVCIFLIAAAFDAAGIRAAWGGAWLMPPGEGQAIVYTAFSDSTRAFDDQGHLIPVPAYTKFELGTYVEYGLTNWLTLVASPAYDVINSPYPGQSYTGPGESELAARVGLFRSDTTVVSVQAGLSSPGGSFADSLGPFLVRRTASLDIRGMVGRNCLILGMDSFIDAEAGYRFYTAGQPDEWRIDLTVGVRPRPRLLVMLQSYTSISNGSFQFGHQSWTKLQPSVVFDITKQWSVQIGGFVTVAGINAGRELGPLAALWFRF